ncbi:response regulator [Microvirga lenta]|uniref:response regulator n=1 Tax=Microvirga lenta TaxID=2881337 RepID=UPI00299F236E|nr:response regulator [Microvirga lenta]
MTSENSPTIILLVEDEALVRMVASEILAEEGGYRIIEAVNADEALSILEARHDVRLVCTDVDMPGPLNGFALARIVDMRRPGIRVIVTSGYRRPDLGDLPKGMRFLPKPYPPSALIEMVRELLGPAERSRTAPPQVSSAPEHGSPVLPGGIKIDQLHTGVGNTGGLAQPLPEPEE